MLKAKAIELLGGTTSSAAKEVGISYQAVDKWPTELPPRIADRVLAAVARKHLPAELIGDEAPVKAAEPAQPAEYTGPFRRATDAQQPTPGVA